MRGNVKAWIEAMRLRTLPVGTAGVIAGTACAALSGSFRWLPALICLVFAVAAQIVSNFANEYYDYTGGLDKKGREGFRRGVTEGDISPRAMKRAFFGLLAFDCLLGCTLIHYGGWWLIAVGIAVAVGALAYSTGPYPLSHHGLGDIAVVVFYGFVPVCFTCYVQTGVWDWQGVMIPVSIAVGLLADNVLIVNNYRDVEDDKEVGKNTLVVLLGRKVMATVYLLFGYTSLALIVIAIMGKVAWGWFPAFAAFALFHTLLWRKVSHSNGKALNPLLGQTALLLLLLTLYLLLLSFLPL